MQKAGLRSLQRAVLSKLFDHLQEHYGVDSSHDMFIDANSAPVVATCAEGVYGYGHFGFPCSTFSPINVLAGRMEEPVDSVVNGQR